MPSQARARRVGDRIQEELADILLREVADPRLKAITVTEVEVDRELAYATIYVTSSDPDIDPDVVIDGLEGASGFLRSSLAARIQLRVFPRLRFRWDASHERGMRVEELLDQIKEEELKRGE